jgi:hypothetical protein
LRYVGDGRHANDVGSIQANQPVPCALLVYYFELTVLDVGEAGRIGLGFSDKHFKLTRQPGCARAMCVCCLCCVCRAAAGGTWERGSAWAGTGGCC